MRELLKELGLEEGRGIGDFVLAREVQRIPEEHGVSRAKGLLAISWLTEDVNEVLRLAGLDRVSFGAAIDVTTMPDRSVILGRYIEDIELRASFDRAIREFASRHPNTREVGLVELARAIFESLDDWSEQRGLARHLAGTGIEAEDVPRLVRALALIRQVPADQGPSLDMSVWQMENQFE